MENHRGNIVLVGVLNQPGSTNIYMAKAFEREGFAVIPVNYRTIMQETGYNTLGSLLYKLAEDKPALMLFSKCNGMSPLNIGKCSQDAKVKTWFWFMDGINTLSKVPECIEHAQLATFSSFTGLGVLNYVKKAIGTGEGMFHIMEGIDPEVYRPVRADGAYDCDIAFIGTHNPEREHYLNLLVNQGYNVRAYGQGFGDEIHGSEFNFACSGAKAMLALSAEYDTQAYFSDRVFRYGACGSFVFHKHAPGLDSYFQHTQDLVYFKDEESLLQVMDYYIRQDNAEARRVIAENLYRKVTTAHTWGNVVKQICAIAEI